LGQPLWTSPQVSYEVIGVVENLSGGGWNAGGIAPDYSMLIPARYFMDGIAPYLVRSQPGQLQGVMPLAAARLQALDASRLLSSPQPVSSTRAQHVKGAVTFMVMLLGVSLLLTLVVILGIVGLAWHWLHDRQVHIGIRRALGARRGDILRHFLAENL